MNDEHNERHTEFVIINETFMLRTKAILKYI